MAYCSNLFLILVFVTLAGSLASRELQGHNRRQGNQNEYIETTKVGICPAYKRWIFDCGEKIHVICQDDSGCAGEMKCCEYGCGTKKKCQLPKEKGSTLIPIPVPEELKPISSTLSPIPVPDESKPINPILSPTPSADENIYNPIKPILSPPPSEDESMNNPIIPNLNPTPTPDEHGTNEPTDLPEHSLDDNSDYAARKHDDDGDDDDDDSGDDGYQDGRDVESLAFL